MQCKEKLYAFKPQEWLVLPRCTSECAKMGIWLKCKWWKQKVLSTQFYYKKRYTIDVTSFKKTIKEKIDNKDKTSFCVEGHIRLFWNKKLFIAIDEKITVEKNEIIILF